MDRPKESTDGRGEGTPPVPSQESSAPGPDLSRVPVEALMDELLNRGFIRGFITAKADAGRPEPVEVPPVEAIYTEVLAQELERRGWECFPPDA
jgi:hypothetical protein